MLRIASGVLLLTASVASLAAAGKPQNIINGNVGPTVPSVAVENNVQRLAQQLHWHTSLAEAKYLAQQENKPIFWIHVLGDLDGTC